MICRQHGSLTRMWSRCLDRWQTRLRGSEEAAGPFVLSGAGQLPCIISPVSWSLNSAVLQYCSPIDRAMQSPPIKYAVVHFSLSFEHTQENSKNINMMHSKFFKMLFGKMTLGKKNVHVCRTIRVMTALQFCSSLC